MEIFSMYARIATLFFALAVTAATFQAQADERPEDALATAQSSFAKGIPRVAGDLTTDPRYADVPVGMRTYLAGRLREGTGVIDPSEEGEMYDFTFLTTEELEKRATASMDGLAMYHLAWRMVREDRANSVSYFDRASVHGVVMSLGIAAGQLVEFARSAASQEERDALLREAHARVVGAVMLGEPIYMNRFRMLNSEFPEIRELPELCERGFEIVASVNRERQLRGMDPYPIMFGESEILELLSHRGQCVSNLDS